MLKKRLILTLYYSDGYFCLSRNFRLQRVGDINWLLNTYHFADIAKYIDEITIINVTEKIENDFSKYLDYVEKIMSKVFLPLTLGGGIRKLSDAKILFGFGADKIQVNHIINSKSLVVKDLVDKYGAQSIVASIDYRRIRDSYKSYFSSGQIEGFDLKEHLKIAKNCNVGEIILNSIDQDGTGTGFDLGVTKYSQLYNIPTLIAGGAGKPEHFHEVLSIESISGASTANLFNFMGRSLEQCRKYLLEQGVLMRI